jgi:hypothetical protein
MHDFDHGHRAVGEMADLPFFGLFYSILVLELVSLVWIVTNSCGVDFTDNLKLK